MKLSDAIRLAGGPRPDLYLGRILVTRLAEDSSMTQLRSAFADPTGAVTDDLVLQDQDEIRIWSRTTFRSQLWVAVVGDALLARQDGDALETNLLARLNLIDGLFASQLGVHIEAASVTLFTRHADEPFGRTTEASDLPEEIADWRATDPTQRAAGLTHVFTGRNLSGRTVGMAYIDALCSRRYSTSLSQATASTTFAALIAAHEIGHVFGAPHDGEGGSACATTPTDFLMAPRINGSQQFSQCSLEQIAPRIEAAACLSPLQSGGGVFDPDDTPDRGGGGSMGLPLLAALALLAWRRQWRCGQMRANQSVR
jgi:hypothetical protein